MAYPTGIELRGNYIIVEAVGSPSIIPMPGLIRLGEVTIRQLPYEYGSYSVDDVVVCDISKTTGFQQGGVNFLVIDEAYILFVTTPAP